ncbi:FAD-binding protein [Desulfospira joergensenii]|uniref:FAD-binding protein n=1 Tax=Desulfospira joergensenii TaxID=53329 RepID=UPI0003B625BB|nr:FAD-binding protein [Desulfospira joergensenii]
MSFDTERSINCDVLIIGGGGAGLRAAIAAASTGADVLMASKTRMGRASNTYLSKAIIASSGWGDPGDRGPVHGQDTIKGGRYINDPGMVARFTETIPRETRRLMEWGMKFNSAPDGSPAVMKIPGHTHARHLSGKNWKGSDLVFPLRQKAVEMGVRFQEKTFVTSLLVSDQKVIGATALTTQGEFLTLGAKTIVLATGGFGHLFLNTNNAPGITGDGHALALDAGVALQDMEFVQFYPTAMGRRGSRILLYERILVQDGVVLKNSRGQDILKKNKYPAEEITRDELAQVMMKEILANPGEAIFMDLEGLAPKTARELAMLIPAPYFKGTRTFPVVPTTHFCMGGVVVDAHCETSCQGLFAAGEVCAGAHGANRLGGNALAEVIAMGSLAGQAAGKRAGALDPVPGISEAARKEKTRLGKLFSRQGEGPADLIRELKETMWIHAGILRSGQSLEKALATLKKLEDTQARIEAPKDLIRFLEFRNLKTTGKALCRSALERTESRGSHFRTDFPEENDSHWRINLRVEKTGAGLALDRVPVPEIDG